SHSIIATFPLDPFLSFVIFIHCFLQVKTWKQDMIANKITKNIILCYEPENVGQAANTVLAGRCSAALVAEHVVLPSSHRTERWLSRQRLRLKARSGRKDFLLVEAQGSLSFLFRLSEP